jgi:hypothetical protein
MYRNKVHNKLEDKYRRKYWKNRMEPPSDRLAPKVEMSTNDDLMVVMEMSVSNLRSENKGDEKENFKFIPSRGFLSSP